MFTVPDLNAWVAEMLAEHVDNILIPAGFRRRAGARSLRRRTDYGSQQLQFLVYSRPRYAPDKAHLHPVITFHMPDVVALEARIFGGPPPRAGTVACALPVDLLRVDTRHRWLFRDRASLDALATTVRHTLDSCVLPFLDASDRLSGFVASPARDHARAEVVAAAYVCLGRGEDALDYLRVQRESGNAMPSELLSPEARERERKRLTQVLEDAQQYLAANPVQRT